MTTATAPAQAFQHMTYRLRLMEARDSAAYADLMAQSPAMGMISIQVVFRQDAFEMLMQRRIGQIVVVAETSEGKLVGTGAADARPIWFEKQTVQAVHLHSIQVHPEFRKHGVATALTQWRINWAHQNYGPNVLIFAEINQNDPAALRNAAKWTTGFGQPRESGFLRVYHSPPPPLQGVELREAIESDYPEIVKGLNEFNRDVNFTRYVTSDRLHRNLEPIHGQIFRHRYVVEEKGQVVGGAVLSNHDPSLETRLIRAPFINKLIARMSGMIHTDGVINGGEIDGIWFKHGHADAAHYMAQWLRYKASQDTDALNFTMTNPKAWEALRISHWQPYTLLSVAYLRPPKLEPYVEKLPSAQGS